MQTCQDFQQELLEDTKGLGAGGSGILLQKKIVKGDYVWVLDDDDYIIDPEFIQKLKDKTATEIKPDVIICYAQRFGKIFPDRLPLELGHCGGINIVVSKSIWMKHRKDWSTRYEGDWDFINAVMKDNPNICYIKELMLAIDRQSLGLSEARFNVGDFDGLEDSLLIKTGDKVYIKNGFAGIGFSFCPEEIAIVTERNIDMLESALRGGLAEIARKFPLSTDSIKNKK
jgi:glycosyltransferase involved in cell wall biosynthesis